jgi:uridine kinase
MRGDVLVIEEKHKRAGKQALELMLPEIEKCKGKFTISVAGESGGGKSEIASVIAELLNQKGIKTFIFQQDDYFVYPPKTNAEMRKKDIGHVGLSEVHVDLLDQNLKDFLEEKEKIEKPLVIFEEDRIDKETVSLEGIRVAIAEGTFTTLLENVKQHIFIDVDYNDTREHRKKRAREKQDEFLEKILKIEHKIISSHKPKAEIIVTKNYDAVKNDGTK